MKLSLSALIILLVTIPALQAAAGPRDRPSAPSRDEWKLTTSDGVQLYVTEFGVGDTVVVLHGGWGAEHSYLIDGLLPLAGRHHFILYDQRGSLRSPCADSLVTVARHVEDLEELRAAIGCRRLRIVAHSMGGFLAMKYMETHPDRVGGLVLVGSVPARGEIAALTTDLQTPTLARWERPSTMRALAAAGLTLAQNPGWDARRRWLWHRITFAAINLHDASSWRSLQGSLFYSGASGAAAGASMQQTWDFTPMLAAATIPIDLILGDDDYIPMALHRAWLPLVPSARLTTIRAAGHAPWVEHPDEFAGALARALARKG